MVCEFLPSLYLYTLTLLSHTISRSFAPLQIYFVSIRLSLFSSRILKNIRSDRTASVAVAHTSAEHRAEPAVLPVWPCIPGKHCITPSQD